MADAANKYPENVPGKFYVDDQCIDSDLCRETAQADLKTFSALGVYGLTTLTCVVAEIPGKVSCIEPVSSDLVREQIAILSKNFPIGAAKMGLLCTAEIVEAVARALLDLSADSAK